MAEIATMPNKAGIGCGSGDDANEILPGIGIMAIEVSLWGRSQPG